MRIEEFQGELPPTTRKGRELGEDTLQLIDSLRESLKSASKRFEVTPEKGRTLKSLQQKLANLSTKMKPELRVRTRVLDDRVVFWAEPFVPEAETRGRKPAAAKPEAQPVKAAPAPKRSRTKKTTTQ